jgi:hypothetical protein
MSSFPALQIVLEDVEVVGTEVVIGRTLVLMSLA